MFAAESEDAGPESTCAAAGRAWAVWTADAVDSFPSGAAAAPNKSRVPVSGGGWAGRVGLGSSIEARRLVSVVHAVAGSRRADSEPDKLA